ncbi:hypothetical protein L1987_49105 [Smallanthus sonchifolius]|uniref:Uncharacterized protein n=1 Tax=Smallanthus sonchifolius TaxID=185202 RepID=A0ACB9FTT8_9ASTR|nr:hypothetical protein L1987_49105 [Smallanthus sonchifolius]
MVYKNPKFDLNKNPTDFYCNDELDKDNQFDDTTLRLECFSQQDSKSAPGDGCGLVLGLGPTPSVCCNDRDLGLKLGLSDHSTAAKSSFSNGFGFHHVVDEGSTSAKRSGGYMPSLLLAPRISVPLQKVIISEPVPLVVSGFLAETVSDQQTSSKKCEFSRGGVWCSHSTDCSKGARGESGLWIKHGGGKKCVVDGWTRSAEGQAGLCVSHGRRCGYHGCKKGAQGSSMFCGVHGGGKLCALTGCTKGSTSFCKAQGGVKRCICGGEGKYEAFARGRGDLCAGHGGGVQETEENLVSHHDSSTGSRALVPSHQKITRCRVPVESQIPPVG